MLIKYFKELLKDKKLIRDCLTLAIPMMLQSLVVSSVNLVDNLMVGALGDAALSGVSSANRYYNIAFFTVNAVVASCIIFLAQYNGANNKEKMKETFRISLVSSYTILFVAVSIIYIFADKLIAFIINDPLIIIQGSRYLKLACLSYLPCGICIAIASGMRALGDSKTPMFISIVSILINAVLDYALIFGKFGLPALEVEGAALATIIARVIEALLYIYFSKKGEYDYETKLSDLFSFDKALLKEIIIKALPLVVNETMWTTGMMMLMKAYSSFGSAINTAYSMSTTVSDLFFVLFSGMATATTVLIGTPLGANKLEEAKGNGYKLIIFSIILSIFFGVGLFLSGYLVEIIFTNVSDESIIAARKFLRCQGCLFWLYMFNTQCYFTLRAGGDTKSTMFMDSGFMWCVNIPIVFSLAYFSHFNVFLVYIIGQCTDLIKAFISFHLVKKEKWVKNLAKEN